MSESPARLAVLFGPRRGTAREVRERLLVGRVPEADLQLLDEKVSREHCVFERKPSGFELRDLGSRNGTWVNGERLTAPRVLQVNDSIGVGETVLVWEADVEALLARDGDSTLIMSKGPLGLTTAAAAPGEDAWARAGKLLLESAIASSGDEAAKKLALAMAEGLGAEAVLICRRNAEGEWQPWLAQPPGATVTAHATLAELAVRQQRAVSVEHHQRHALRDEQTTSLTSAPAFVMCAPLVGDAQGGAVFAVRRSTFDSRELALATALAQAASPSLKVEPAVAAPRASELALIAESASMKALVASAQRVAPAGSTVLLTGESGSGKEMLARFIHQHSKRVRGPFIALNCGALPRELAESELFGHERGAFTGATQTHPGVFERAQGGTLFLDEVGELLPELQVKLLRVLEERLVWRLGARVPTTIDVRLVAATNRELELDVKEKKFRADLFWRLNVVRLTLEPLRSRRDDLAPLTRSLIARHARSLGRATSDISAEAMKALERCDWPGNVRQLSNAIERALVLKAGDGPIDLSDLPPELLGGPAAAAEDHGAPRTLAERIAQVEREQILLAMQRARGVKAQAATELGISRPTLDRKLEEYDIDWVADR
ncbi:MAG: sigma 54-interacting transcriptional regulator [Archangium sp.]|nr:sigma 54-interacting transcriptional regulator [Archangium sp.]